MRRLNAMLSMIILVLFVVHGVLGAFNMMAIGSVTTRVLAWTMTALILIHILLGICFTIQTLHAQKKAGAVYFKENRLFWARRLSGLLVMILIFFHIAAFSGVSKEHYRLPDFEIFQLLTQILLVLSIGVHVVTNVKPMLIAFGIKKLKPKAVDMIFWISALLLFMVAAFIIYYIRWSAV